MCVDLHSNVHAYSNFVFKHVSVYVHVHIDTCLHSHVCVYPNLDSSLYVFIFIAICICMCIFKPICVLDLCLFRCIFIIFLYLW